MIPMQIFLTALKKVLLLKKPHTDVTIILDFKAFCKLHTVTPNNPDVNVNQRCLISFDIKKCNSRLMITDNHDQNQWCEAHKLIYAVQSQRIINCLNYTQMSC